MSFQHDGWTRIMSNIIKKNLLDMPSAVCLGRWRRAAQASSPDGGTVARWRDSRQMEGQVVVGQARDRSDKGDTYPETDHRLLLEQLNLTLPAQPPPRISCRGKLLNHD